MRESYCPENIVIILKASNLADLEKIEHVLHLVKTTHARKRSGSEPR